MADDRSAQVRIRAEVATSSGCHCTTASGAQAPGKAWEGGACVCTHVKGCGGWGGGLERLKDMAPFPISLGDNKKGMLEKGKQREESTKTKARARSV